MGYTHVISSLFDIVEAGASTEGVVGEVEDVITLVIRQVILEQVESFVDGLGESEFAHQEWDGTDAAGCDGSGPGSDFVVEIRGGEDGHGRGRMDGPVEPEADFPLAGGVVLVWNRYHSKSPCGYGHEICVGRSNVPETPGDFEFLLTHHVV